MQAPLARGAYPLVLALFAALATALALFALPGTASAQTDDEVTPARADGRNRFETAATLAELTFTQADTAVVVTGQNYPDALAGSFAAGSVGGPLLLVTRDGVPAATWETLQDLEVETVVLVGGSEAISEDVEEEIAANGYETERVFGVNRFQTASAVAMRFGSDDGVGTLAGDRTALVASGEAFPDALSAGPLAAGASLPLFLIPSDQTEVSVNRSLATPTVLSPDSDGWLADTCPAIDFVRAIGGVGAVSEQVLGAAVDAAGACEGEPEPDPDRKLCRNVEAGFIVSYPGDWFTNRQPIDQVPICALFDPDPDDIRAEGNEIPLDIGGYLRVEDVDFEDVANVNPEAEEQIARQETSIDGREAVRLETRATGDGAIPPGTEQTRWAVDLGEGTFIASAFDVGDPTYAHKQEVLDRMMDDVAFDD